MEDEATAMERKRQIHLIRNSVDILSFENKKAIVSLIIRDEGYAPLVEYASRNCVAVDLDAISRPATLEKIHDIVRKRRDSISIRRDG